MSRRYERVCTAHSGLFLGLVLLSLLTRKSIAGAEVLLQLVGFSMSGVGVALLIAAGIQLRRAGHRVGQDEPEALATEGPYRWVRHPWYLSGILFVFGLALGLRSVWGVVAAPLLLVPSAIYVAKLEEEWLAQRFGDTWQEYVERTHMLFPGIY